MSTLEHEIFCILQEEKTFNNIFNKLSKCQKKLMKNYSNQVFNNEDKTKLLNIYNQLQNIGNSLYRYNTLKSYNMDIQEEKENIENIVLKGGISNVRYIWHSEHGENTCDECLDLDGKEFDIFDEVPERPHVNCKCTVEVVKQDDIEQNNDVSIKKHKTKQRYQNALCLVVVI